MSETSSTIPLTCDCGHFIQVPNRYAGRRIKCPRCGAKHVVEDQSIFPEMQSEEIKADIPPIPAVHNTTETGRTEPVRIPPHRRTTTVSIFSALGLLSSLSAFFIAFVILANEGPPALAGIIFISLLASGIILTALSQIIDGIYATAHYTKVIAQLIAQQNE